MEEKNSEDASEDTGRTFDPEDRNPHTNGFCNVREDGSCEGNCALVGMRSLEPPKKS